jgi:hypothetical protein
MNVILAAPKLALSSTKLVLMGIAALHPSYGKTSRWSPVHRAIFAQ